MARTPPVVALNGARITFGGRPLFDGISMSVVRGDRICLVGRNGCGKSTLLKALAGEIELDGGARFVQPAARVVYLPQDPVVQGGQTVADHVAAGVAAAHFAARKRLASSAESADIGLRPCGAPTLRREIIDFVDIARRAGREDQMGHRPADCLRFSARNSSKSNGWGSPDSSPSISAVRSASSLASCSSRSRNPARMTSLAEP